MSIKNKKKPVVILAVCGSIAAYKVCELIRQLTKSQIETHVIMTQNATKFIGKVTFETLSGNKVFSSEWEEGMLHIDMKNKADLMVVVPATANMIGKMANAIADDVVSSSYLAMQVPVIVAPAMNPGMYTNKAVQRNLSQLKEDGVVIIEPASGLVICGDEGQGKMADVLHIYKQIVKRLEDI